MSRGWDWLRPCLGCDHLDDIGCAYLEHTGRRRPCPPGEGCTEYAPRKAKSRPPLPAWAPQERTRLTHRPVGRRAWKVEELNQSQAACRLYAEGASDHAIARAAGCSVNTVAKWRRETGRPANYPNRKKDAQNGNQDHDPQGAGP